MLKTEANKIIDQLEIMFPNARCELDFKNNYELCVAVMLSAQTTDKLVNTVTPDLFKKYPDVYTLSKANISELENDIKRIGLYKNKAKNLILFANQIIDKYNGNIPNNLEDLITLAGIGRKTANVVLAEGFNVPRIAVDTHVDRVSKRLGFSKEENSVLDVEKDLMNIFEEKNWHRNHLLLLFFGRYFCKAQKPNCIECPFKNTCKYIKK